MPKIGKRLSRAKKMFEQQSYQLQEVVSKLLPLYNSEAAAKFDETVEVAINLNIDARKSNQIVRGTLVMPHSLGKKFKIAAFVDEGLSGKALEMGADIAGGEDLIEELKGGGKILFDKCIATPTMMPKVASALGKILGTKGLMPNPKLGTVGDDILKIIREIKEGKVEFRNDKAGIIHAAVGKLSFNKDKLKDNIIAFYNAIIAAKPSNINDLSYIRNMHITTTQGASIMLDLSSFIA